MPNDLQHQGLSPAEDALYEVVLDLGLLMGELRLALLEIKSHSSDQALINALNERQLAIGKHFNTLVNDLKTVRGIKENKGIA